MEEHLSPLAVTHLLQHTLRSLCIHENSQWVYAVFWRILPRNYPPPKWDSQGGAYDRSRGNRRNWILVWEDGFCNFAASASAETNSGDCPGGSSSVVYGNSSSCEFQQFQGLQPELFFKMSHEIYNYGEGLIGKVAADHSHKWVFKEPNDQEINFLSAWHNSADSHPRTWEAQFHSGIKTIALIAVREGVVQLGAVHKVIEDLSYVVLLRKKLSYIESIPGVLLPHPSSSSFPYYNYNYNYNNNTSTGTPPELEAWHYHQAAIPSCQPASADQLYIGDQCFNNNINNQSLTNKMITPSMSSLEALLSKLPSVVPPPQLIASGGYSQQPQQPQLELMGMEKMMKEEANNNDQEYNNNNRQHDQEDLGESSSSMAAYHRYYAHHQAI